MQLDLFIGSRPAAAAAVAEGGAELASCNKLQLNDELETSQRGRVTVPLSAARHGAHRLSDVTAAAAAAVAVAAALRASLCAARLTNTFPVNNILTPSDDDAQCSVLPASESDTISR